MTSETLSGETLLRPAWVEKTLAGEILASQAWPGSARVASRLTSESQPGDRKIAHANVEFFDASKVVPGFRPTSDHWMLTIAVLAVLVLSASLPSPLMVITGLLTVCYLAPAEVLPAMLAICGLISLGLLLMLPL